MKILINCFSALHGGGVTYLNNLIPRLATYPNVELHIYGFSKANYEKTKIPNIRDFSFLPANKSRVIRFFFEKIILPIKIYITDYDILFYPGGTVSCRAHKSASIVTMSQNMLPLQENYVDMYKYSWQWFRLKLLKKRFYSGYKLADHVVFLSNHAKNMICRHNPEILHKSSIIPHGVHSVYRQIQRRKNEHDVLYVSDLNYYKHQVEVIKGFEKFLRVSGANCKLKLVGKMTSQYQPLLIKTLNEVGCKDHIELLGFVNSDDLLSLYQKSKLIIFASGCENCPNILLEAMAAGKAIICSNREPMPEFLNGAGLYFDPTSPEDLAQKLLKLYPDEKLIDTLAERARDESQKYEWDSSVATLHKLFEKLAY